MKRVCFALLIMTASGVPVPVCAAPEMLTARIHIHNTGCLFQVSPEDGDSLFVAAWIYTGNGSSLTSVGKGEKTVLISNNGCPLPDIQVQTGPVATAGRLSASLSGIRSGGVIWPLRLYYSRIDGFEHADGTPGPGGRQLPPVTVNAGMTAPAATVYDTPGANQGRADGALSRISADRYNGQNVPGLQSSPARVMTGGLYGSVYGAAGNEIRLLPVSEVGAPDATAVVTFHQQNDTFKSLRIGLGQVVAGDPYDAATGLADVTVVHDGERFSGVSTMTVTGP